MTRTGRSISCWCHLHYNITANGAQCWQTIKLLVFLLPPSQELISWSLQKRMNTESAPIQYGGVIKFWMKTPATNQNEPRLPEGCLMILPSCCVPAFRSDSCLITPHRQLRKFEASEKALFWHNEWHQSRILYSRTTFALKASRYTLERHIGWWQSILLSRRTGSHSSILIRRIHPGPSLQLCTIVRQLCWVTSIQR